MVEELLVAFPREAGWRLLDKLDATGLEITDAFWQYREEAEDWRLYLVTNLREVKDYNFALRTINHLLEEMSEDERDDLDLTDISLAHSQQREVLEMRRRGTVAERGQRLRRRDIAHHEPFVYRLQTANAPLQTA